MPMLATLLFLACATESPSAQVTIQTPTRIEHGTVIAQCPLTANGNYDRLVKLMQKPVQASEVPQIPEVK